MKNLILSFLICSILFVNEACIRSGSSQNRLDGYYSKIPRKDLSLYINSKEEMFADGVEVSKSELCDKVSPFIKNSNKIIWQNDSELSYLFYIEIFNMLSACYIKQWNIFSDSIFNKDYIDLSEDEKKVILHKIPFELKEIEPRN